MSKEHQPQIVQDANSIVTQHIIDQMRDVANKPDGEWAVISLLRWLHFPFIPPKEYEEHVVETVKKYKK